MQSHTLLYVLTLGIAVLCAVIFLIYLKALKARLKDQSNIIRKLQEQQRDKLDMVETTLNPHLFKNILNSIQSHAYQTYFALDKLANVLDYILYESRKDFVSPQQEISFLQNLIEINKIKVSPLFDLQVKKKINEHESLYAEAVMAPIITADLIENAFKHADLQSPDAFIRIAIEFNDGIFTLTVANKVSEKPPLPRQQSGIGVKTLDQRLQLIYGAHASIERILKSDQYIAQLKIRLREYKTEMRSA